MTNQTCDDTSKPTDGGFSRRNYIQNRTKNLHGLFTDLNQDRKLCESFFTGPSTVAEKYGVTLNDEEIFLVKSLRNADLMNILERLTLSPIANYDANCQCGVLAPLGSTVAQ